VGKFPVYIACVLTHAIYTGDLTHIITAVSHNLNFVKSLQSCVTNSRKVQALPADTDHRLVFAEVALGPERLTRKSTSINLNVEALLQDKDLTTDCSVVIAMPRRKAAPASHMVVRRGTLENKAARIKGDDAERDVNVNTQRFRTMCSSRVAKSIASTTLS